MGHINLSDNAPPGFFSGAVPDPTPDGEPAPVLCIVCAGTGRDCEEGSDGRLHYVECKSCGGSGDLPDWEALSCENDDC